MDDIEVGDTDQQRGRGPRSHAKHKYMAMLQEIADRKREHIIIDLDDLQEVRGQFPRLQ